MLNKNEFGISVFCDRLQKTEKVGRPIPQANDKFRTDHSVLIFNFKSSKPSGAFLIVCQRQTNREPQIFIHA